MLKCVCSACGASRPWNDPTPHRCPHAGDSSEIDHILEFALPDDLIPQEHADSENPFLRYREYYYTYQAARRAGMGDERYQQIVTELDAAVAKVAGRGFRRTPLRAAPAQLRAGVESTNQEPPLWLKDETQNVGESHKARHLFAVLIHRRIAIELGWAPQDPEPTLAIASCGNASIAAALLARAEDLPLDVFVPVDAESEVVAQMQELGATVHFCKRTDAPGDPCMTALLGAVSTGSLPFTVQGPWNGLVVESGKCLGLEMHEQLQEQGATPQRLFIQVGGGALATSVCQGWELRQRFRGGASLPAVHPVQTSACAPLAQAFDRLCQDDHTSPEDRLVHAARQRQTYMKPWPIVGRSIARGILDDETYDWRSLLGYVLGTGGAPRSVEDPEIARAVTKLHETGFVVSATGAVGCAAALEFRDSSNPTQDVVILTGVR